MNEFSDVKPAFLTFKSESRMVAMRGCSRGIKKEGLLAAENLMDEMMVLLVKTLLLWRSG